MRILVLSFYYHPDLSAGSFRVTALVAALRALMPPGSHIDVITTLPNRYRSFSIDAPEHETHPGLAIRRIALRPHASGMLDQSAAFLTFVRGARAATASHAYDLVFATSSRLMTAVLGAWIARGKRAKLYLDIRDIFADTIKDVLKGPSATMAGTLFSRLERTAFASADRINVVSGGFREYFQRRYPRLQLSCITNGIDDEFVAAAPSRITPSPRPAGGETLTALYAGNIGEGQGLDRILPPLAAALGHRIRFRVIGAGGRLAALERAIRAAGIDNIELQGPVGRAELIEAYRAVDILFLHLNDYPAFHKVLPSKLFEYAAMGKPVWAGVAGFAAAFVQSEITNAAVFPPGDVDAAIRALDTLRLEDGPRAEFLSAYERNALSARLADDVLSLLAARAGGTR